MISAINIQSTNPEEDERNLVPRCTRNSCIIEESVSVEEIIRSSYFETERLKSAFAKYGITFVENRVGTAQNNQARSLTGALRRSAFGAVDITVAGETYTETFRFGWAGGVLAGARPSVSGFWRGTMTGVDENEGHRLRGDVKLNYWASRTGGTLSAGFSNIRAIGGLSDIDGEFEYTGIEVNSDETFSQGDESFGIKGGFYGSSNSEISGTFVSDDDDILGSFGALKDECVLQGSEIRCSVGGRLSTQGTPSET